MPKPLSQALLDRKRERAREALTRKVAEWSSMPFGAFTHVPTAEQVVSMFLAARFGPGDPLSAGGDAFAVEYVLDEVWAKNTNDMPARMAPSRTTPRGPDGAHRHT